MNPLESVTKKIQEAVPEIMELKFGCEINAKGEKLLIYNIGHSDIYVFAKHSCGRDEKIKVSDITKIIGRPITLEDVLITFGNDKFTTDKAFYVDVFGEFIDYKTHLVVSNWTLGKPLHLQPQPTIEWLDNNL